MGAVTLHPPPPQGILVHTERFQDCHRGSFGRSAAEQPRVPWGILSPPQRISFLVQTRSNSRLRSPDISQDRAVELRPGGEAELSYHGEDGGGQDKALAGGSWWRKDETGQGRGLEGPRGPRRPAWGFWTWSLEQWGAVAGPS